MKESTIKSSSSRITVEQRLLGPRSDHRKVQAQATRKIGSHERLKITLQMEVEEGRPRPVMRTLDPPLQIVCSDPRAVAFVRGEFRGLINRLRQYNAREREKVALEDELHGDPAGG